MQPTDVDPGVKLAGRYRVAELLAEAPGDGGVARTWRAVDEVLSRSVVLHIMAADDPRATPLLEASRRAATASDVRFIRVLDALRDDGVAYVVREWVAGRNLGAVLGEGPLPPRYAGLVVREVAEALASAHDQGLSHERLDPDSVVITESGSIKIVGLATQAALTEGLGGSETPPGETARADAIGLGRLLYAALTARWPSGPRSGLGAAPRAADGTLLSPRQCRAGVPRTLDDITERVLSERPHHGPLVTPHEIAAALADAVGATPPEGVLPPAPSRGPDGTDDATVVRDALSAPTIAGATPVVGGFDPTVGPGGPNGGERVPDWARSAGQGQTASFTGGPSGGGGGGPGPYARQPPRYAPAPYRPPRRGGPRWRRIAGILVALVLLAGATLLGWQLTRQAFDAAGGEPSTSPSSDENTPAAKPAAPFAIAAAEDFDPEPDGNGEEHPEEVPLIYDGKADTAWRTMEYYDPLDVQKPGVGFWVDLGSVRDIGRVDLALVGEGTSLELRAAPEDATEPPATPDEWQRFTQTSNAGERVKLEPDDEVRTRYVLVWLTKLPPEGGNFRGGVAEITVRR